MFEQRVEDHTNAGTPVQLPVCHQPGREGQRGKVDRYADEAWVRIAEVRGQGRDAQTCGDQLTEGDAALRGRSNLTLGELDSVAGPEACGRLRGGGRARGPS
jgi:hypothetical protein